MNTVHIIAQFAALARLHGLQLHQSHGQGGWALWMQARHGASYSMAHLKGICKLTVWVGRLR